MAKKGYNATKVLRERARDKRGGQDREVFEFDREVPENLADFTDEYLQWLLERNYSTRTVQSRRYALEDFLQWCRDRDLIRSDSITKPVLESYQRFLYRYRKVNGKPLGFSTQRGKLSGLKDFFRWLCRQNYLLYNPASELELPRPEKRLPEEPLSAQQLEAIFALPDLVDLLGLRDRAILELFYSTGMRRSELVALEVSAVNLERFTIQIRQGKGKKDRVVPSGLRALFWVERYLQEVRPHLLLNNAEQALFITSYGERFHADFLSRLVASYIKRANIGRTGSCHLFRHTCATHMLENGADIRFIQQLLGHEKLETTQIYTEVSIRQLKEVHTRTHPGAK